MTNKFSANAYIDHSSSALSDNSSILQAQSSLQSLGMDIGSSTPDGNWGPSSQAAAKEWQSVNGYEATGDITVRQMSVLEHQADNPSIYNRMKLDTFYENFDDSVLSNLDPVRANIIAQQASHLGVKEHIEPGAEEGTNSGPAIDQYAVADSRFPGQGAWCDLSQSWIMDQVEKAAGIEKDSFHKGTMRVHETLDQISTDHPEAVADLREYEPQAGDIMLITHDDGTGHASTVVASFDDGNGYSTVITMDGNVDDGMNLGQRDIYTDPDTGEIYETDEEGNFTGNSNITIVDISSLPNYDKMNSNFNAAAEFTPTPSADPNFEPDIEQLATLQWVFEEKAAMSKPAEPQPQPQPQPVEPLAPVALDSVASNEPVQKIESPDDSSNVIEGDFTGHDTDQAGDPKLLREAQAHLPNNVEAANTTSAPTITAPANVQHFAT